MRGQSLMDLFTRGQMHTTLSPKHPIMAILYNRKGPLSGSEIPVLKQIDVRSTYMLCFKRTTTATGFAFLYVISGRHQRVNFDLITQRH